MKKTFLTNSFDRRTVIKTGAALGASALFSPPILTFAQGETPIKIGMHDPFTGTYHAPRQNTPGQRPQRVHVGMRVEVQLNRLWRRAIVKARIGKAKAKRWEVELVRTRKENSSSSK